MSPISIDRFVATAQLSNGGDVRIARGSEDQLVNKGALGHRMASAIENFARNIGLMRPDPTRAARQQQALASFTEALQHRYGDDSAAAAIQQLGLNQDGARLTGRVIRQAVALAEAGRQTTRLDNLGAMQAFLPPLTGHAASDAFRTLASQLAPDLDPDQLDPLLAQAYTERLGEAVRIAGRQGSDAIDHDSLANLARSTLKSVLKLERSGQLAASVQARNDYRDALGQLVEALRGGRGPGTIMDRMATALKAFDKLAATEHVDEVGGGEFHDFTQAGLISFMESLGPQQGPAAREALAAALAKDGALRGLVASINHQMGTVAMQPEPLMFAGRIKAMGISLVQTLGVLGGAHTGTSDADLDLLETSPREDGTPPTRALQQLQARLASVPTGAQAIIDEILMTRGSIDTASGFPRWHDPETFEHLEIRLSGTHHALGTPMETLINEFRAALDERNDVPPGLRDKLRAGLDVLQGRATLGAAIAQTPGFPAIGENKLWQLFSSAEQRSDPEFSGWHLEHFNQGSVSGMQRAFTRMLEDRQNGVPLDAGWLEQIHSEAVTGTFRTEALALTYKPDVQENPALIDTFLELARLTPGYRSSDTDLKLKLDSSTSEAGRAELLALGRNDPWFGPMDSGGVGGNTFAITLPQPPSPEAARNRATQILAAFHDELGKATTDDQKLLAVARATQSLYRSHLFEDGNTRSVVFVAMNRMLLDAGLPPAMLADPKAAAGLGLEEFARQIREGQQQLATLG